MSDSPLAPVCFGCSGPLADDWSLLTIRGATYLASQAGEWRLCVKCARKAMAQILKLKAKTG